MRHKLREISPDRITSEPCSNGTPEYSIKIRFFDPDGITILGDPDEVDEFPDILTEQAFRMDINHELEPVSPKVTTRFKEEVHFGPDYTPDLRSEEVTIYKHRKRDLSFADYQWYSSGIYITPKMSPPVHRTTVFLYPEENYISSVIHEVEQCQPLRELKLNDVTHDVTMRHDDVTEINLRSWDAKFTFDEDQLELQLREMDDYRNKIKQDNIPTIFEGVELDGECSEWNDIPGGSLKKKKVPTATLR